MTLAVLQTAEQARDARLQMRHRGVSRLPPAWLDPLLELAGADWLRWGDGRKSWDVWKSADFLQANLPPESPVLDLGAYRSEILPVLHRLGFTRLHGIDLNPAVRRGPHRDAVQYSVEDFYRTSFPADSFAAVTSISAIEHGLDLPRLLGEVSRILRPGGYFLCSTDYWPEKIETNGIKIFDMSWTIFSADEISVLIDSIRPLGLVPVGPLEFGAVAPVVRHAGRAYTFAWLALQKKPSP